ncbi:MAG: hypothetical protein B7Z66_06480 [Chromatiales bacterium 21-64-14]|nr:MAG: hypothetical protein B7Z66_06480 [Chromatiales bacterium 21-64-14]HQU16937.1 CBS domain-containing protein [Gammaproteobacteria bacterium]
MARAEQLSLAFVEAHPADAARVLERLAPESAAALLEAAPVRLTAPVVRHMMAFHAARCVEPMEAEAAAGLMRALGPQSGTAVLRYLLPEQRDAILEQLPSAVAALFRLLVGYPEDTVGAWMDPDALALHADCPAEEALAHMNRVRDPERALYVYVVSSDHQLRGVAHLAEVVRASPNVPLARLMHAPPAVVRARAGLRSVHVHPAWEDLRALPVVDWGGRFAGVLHRADLTRALAQQGPVSSAQVGEALAALTGAYWLGMFAMIEAGLRVWVDAAARGDRRDTP